LCPVVANSALGAESRIRRGSRIETPRDYYLSGGQPVTRRS
jgi:hypothetical protein